MIPYVVSGCLAGLPCRYDGGTRPCEAVRRLVDAGRAVTACPETLADLPVPRPPSEQRNGRVVSREGKDLTEDFERGACRAMDIVRRHGCTAAILKARSPACGCGRIYDGTFSGTLCDGDGVWTRKLREAGLTLYTEENLPDDVK